VSELESITVGECNDYGQIFLQAGCFSCYKVITQQCGIKH